jgi:peptidoglycan/xylan/chitin deacetylase (PgdA/CDA1 family)
MRNSIYARPSSCRPGAWNGITGGHEIAHHGYLHEHPNACEPEQELYWFQRASDVIERMTSQRPRGFRAPSYRFSRATLDVLIQEGLTYDASLMGDDVPYLLENDTGQVVELPTHYAMDDWPHFMVSRDLAYMMSPKSPQQAMEGYQAEFDAMWEYGGLWIAVWHPFLSGRLARCVAMARLIEYMHDKGQVWFATLEDIAAHVRHLMAAGGGHALIVCLTMMVLFRNSARLRQHWPANRLAGAGGTRG